MWYLLSILGCMIIINIALLGYIPRINFPISKSYSFFIVVIALILLVIIYEWRPKKNKLSSYFLSKINPHVEAIIFATCILSLSIGIFIMKFFNGDPNTVSNTFSGLSVIAFGVTLWTILTAFQEKNKENNTSHDDIEGSKQQNNVSSTHPNENKKGENKMSIEKYINDRLDDQIKYYDLKSIEYKKKHENISLATIIISALIALVPAFIDILPNCKGIITFLSALLAATITVLQAIDKLKKYNDLFYQFRMTCEKLKQEKELYLYQSGEYKRTDEMTNEQLFVERCESIMATENGTWAQLNEKKAN